MIAARQIAFGGSAKRWENPYITDGLVIHLDGEWNGGYGIHNSGSSLVELISKQSAIISGGDGTYFDEKSIILKRYGSTTCSFYPLTQDQINFRSSNSTFEICAEFDTLTKLNNNNGIFWATPTGGGTTSQHWCSAIGLRCWNGLVFTGGYGQKINGQALSYSQKDITGSYCIGNELMGNNQISANVDYYLHGKYKSTEVLDGAHDPYRYYHMDSFGLGMKSGTEYKGFGDNQLRIHSIRIYNRVLTAEEIAHNYEIDKARFGL
jgi:hypothetical protein